MGILKIGNKEIEYNKYLSSHELRLFSISLKAALSLWLLGYAKIGTFKPEGFTAQTDFYLVKDRNKYYISYSQGWRQVFYIPEVHGK